MSKNATLSKFFYAVKILKFAAKYKNNIETINNKIKQKINILSKKYRQRDLSLDLYLVEKNVFDGSIKSNYQRMIEGKNTGKLNRFFHEREEEEQEI